MQFGDQSDVWFWGQSDVWNLNYDNINLICRGQGGFQDNPGKAIAVVIQTRKKKFDIFYRGLWCDQVKKSKIFQLV